MPHPTPAAAQPPRHGTQRSDGYARRRPEDTVLYQTIAEHWPDFSERLAEHGGLPRFVEREFESYLQCGILDFGFLEFECRQCGHTELVALSCKRRGFCPSCLARRMSDSAVHLERSVLPEVPIRHWICSFPWGVRAVLGYDAELCASAARAFASELMRSLRLRAKKLLALGSVRDAFSGAVVAIQRTDSALRLNVHLHVLALDGVYVRDLAGTLVFQPLPTASAKDVAQIARRSAERLGRAFQAQGRPNPGQPTAADEPDPEPLSLQQPGLFACYQVAARGLSVSGERAGHPAPSYSNPTTCSHACVPQYLRRACTCYATSAYFRVITRSPAKSRHPLRPNLACSNLRQRRVISKPCPSMVPTLSRRARGALAGVGSSGMYFSLTSSTAAAVAVRCAGSRPPPAPRPSPGCSPNTASPRGHPRLARLSARTASSALRSRARFADCCSPPRAPRPDAHVLLACIPAPLRPPAHLTVSSARLAPQILEPSTSNPASGPELRSSALARPHRDGARHPFLQLHWDSSPTACRPITCSSCWARR